MRMYTAQIFYIILHLRFKVLRIGWRKDHVNYIYSILIHQLFQNLQIASWQLEDYLLQVTLYTIQTMSIIPGSSQPEPTTPDGISQLSTFRLQLMTSNHHVMITYK